jgi:adenylate cyclase
MGTDELPRKLAAILYADVADYSRLTGKDEDGTHRLLRDYLDCMSDCVDAHGGRVVHYAGDAVLAEFSTVSTALRCAATVQQELAHRNALLPEERRVRFRMGVNLGEVIEDRGDIYGQGVNVAARLESLAEPGGICVSESVRAAAGNKLPLRFEFVGEREVKNIAEPLRVYAVHDGERAIDEVSSTVTAGDDGDALTPSSASERPSIAVMPFACLAEDRALEYLTEGLSEDLTTLLARIPGFVVISHGSAMAYRGQRIDTRKVSEELGVRYVVEGSLRPMGSKVRATAHLIDASTGNQLWGERFDRPADQILELQDDITQAIVARIEPELARAEFTRVQRRPPGNLDAWELYQRAHGLLSLKGWAPETFLEAMPLLRQAVALDDEFALAHAYMSLMFAVSHMFQLGEPGASQARQAVEAADRAMELDGRDSSVLGYVGCALCDIGRSHRGVELLERAVEADPSNAQAWAALGVGLIRERRPREGVEKLRHGIQISPMDSRLAYWGAILANALFRLREYDEALKEAQAACRRNDRFANARVVVAMIQAHQGRMHKAAEAMDEARRLLPDLSARHVAGLIGNRGVAILARAGLMESA